MCFQPSSILQQKYIVPTGRELDAYYPVRKG